ncbi:MAG: TIGR03086 family metal-binding protein [Mycobacterium sp.]|uniref:TIGR03086 family metal-binding protein n=1 Tax=Mycobacterium sp. TaxID=1785 RepID=UPI003CC64DB2
MTDVVDMSAVSSREGRDIATLHLAVCRRFSDPVSLGAGKWDRPTPCQSWDARAVVEHVIGFHDMLLRPLGLKPDRPRGDPRRRWELTVDRVREAFARDGLFGRLIAIPAVGTSPATQLDATYLVPRLTQDVLVHTWDLARAVEADDRLDPGWCAMFLSRLPTNRNALTGTGMFAAPIVVDDDADIQSRLLAALGRDPSWQPGTPAPSGQL